MMEQNISLVDKTIYIPTHDNTDCNYALRVIIPNDQNFYASTRIGTVEVVEDGLSVKVDEDYTGMEYKLMNIEKCEVVMSGKIVKSKTVKKKTEEKK